MSDDYFVPVKILFIPVFAMLVSACQQTPIITEIGRQTETTLPAAPPTAPIPSRTEAASELGNPPVNNIEIFAGLTYTNPDGNRVIQGEGMLPFRQPVDIPLPAKAIWLVATRMNNGIIWTAALEDGRSFSFRMDDKGNVVGEPAIVELPPGMPPAAISDGEVFSLIQVQDAHQSVLSHPIYLPLSDSRAYITTDGKLKIIDANDGLVSSLDGNALLDARIVKDERDRLLLLSDPTHKYAHGVLGDPLEATAVTLIETFPEASIVRHIHLPDHEVIEGIAPIWADMTGDGQREIIVTVSDLDLGAGIVILDEIGERLAEGPKMGIPFRWRHQIAVSRFGSGANIELAVVRTPHIGGNIEFYQLKDGELSITAEFPGVTSHTLGSRNLDLAAAGDFDGDGSSELLVLSPDLREYIAVRRTTAGAERVWGLPVDGVASSNLAGAPLPGGGIVLGIGRSDHILRLWIPQE